MIRVQSSIVTAFFALALCISTAHADHSCSVEAIASCIMDDARTEFLPYKGLPCREFQSMHTIDMEKVRSNAYSENTNAKGFPLIKVKYLWKMCNTNIPSNESVLMDPTQSYAKIKSVAQPINKGGTIKQGKCRKFEIQTLIDSEVRYHKLETKMMGYLKIGQKVYNAEPEIRKCEDKVKYQVRLKYSNDCKVQATTACVLKDANGDGTDVPCDGNIEYTYPTCTDVPVRYKFRACNFEDHVIRLNTKKSKYKLNKEKLGNLESELKAMQCITHTHDAVMNSCDNTSPSYYCELKYEGGAQ